MEDPKKEKPIFDRKLTWKIYEPLTEEEEKMVEKLRRSIEVEIIKMYESD